jgi:hypothetical protein
MAGPLYRLQRSKYSRTSALNQIPIVLGTGSKGQSLAISSHRQWRRRSSIGPPTTLREKLVKIGAMIVRHGRMSSSSW